jgi:hypothetical protein
MKLNLKRERKRSIAKEYKVKEAPEDKTSLL